MNNIIELVNNFVEKGSDDLGWKESYINVKDCIVDNEPYFEDLEPVTEEDLKGMCRFWKEDSLLKDYIVDATYVVNGDKKGRVTLELRKYDE